MLFCITGNHLDHNRPLHADSHRSCVTPPRWDQNASWGISWWIPPTFHLVRSSQTPEANLISKWRKIFYHIKWNYWELFSARTDKIAISQIDWLFHYLPGDLGRHRVDNLLMFPVTSPDLNDVFGYMSTQSFCLPGSSTQTAINIHGNMTVFSHISVQPLQT